MKGARKGLNPQEEVEKLRQTLEAYNYQYYVLDAPTISDFEYDQMLRRLEVLEAEHPELQSADSPSGWAVWR